MGEQLTTSAAALRLFFTDDIYLVASEEPAPVKAEVIQVAVEQSVPAVKAAIVQSEPIKVAVAQTADYKYLGKNQKNVLILVNDAANGVSTEQGRELLRKLVKAIDLTANDFALVNYAACQGTSFNALTSFFSSKLVLAFGVTPLELGLEEQPRHEIILHTTMQLVFSANLDQLAGDQNGKKILWGSLQKLK